MPTRRTEINKQLAAFSWLQALGTNFAAIGQTKLLSKRKKERDEGEKLIIMGNTLQAIANGAQAELTLEKGKYAENKRDNTLNALGNLLQSIGNYLEVISSHKP